MKKYIFMDVDGTLLHTKTGIPKSAIYAIQEARRNGHKVFICTGRAKSQVGASIIDIGFDGYIFSAGTAIEAEGKLIHFDQLDPEVVAAVVKDLDKFEVGYLLEGFDFSYMDKHIANYFSKMHKELFVSDIGASYLIERNMKSIKEYDQSALINKLSFFPQHHDTIVKLKESYESKFDFLVHDDEMSEFIAAELILPGVTKATGMDIILNYYNGDIKDTISLGDSRNDIEMVQHADIGICMENGITILKEVADYVTDSVENDGVYKAFKKYGIIKEEKSSKV